MMDDEDHDFNETDKTTNGALTGTTTALAALTVVMALCAVGTSAYHKALAGEIHRDAAQVNQDARATQAASQRVDENVGVQRGFNQTTREVVDRTDDQLLRARQENAQARQNLEAARQGLNSARTLQRHSLEASQDAQENLHRLRQSATNPPDNPPVPQ